MSVFLWLAAGIAAYVILASLMIVGWYRLVGGKRRRYLWPDGRTSLHRPPKIRREIDWDFPEGVGTDERE